MSKPATYAPPAPLPSGATFADLRAGGLTGVLGLVIAANPALDKLVAGNPALAEPAAAITAGPTGGGATGGSLPAGTYRASITFADGLGQTTAGLSRSAKFTVEAGNIPRLALPDLPPGAESMNIFLTPPGGVPGSEGLYAAGITASTYDLAAADWADGSAAPPPTNTTGLATVGSLVWTGKPQQLPAAYHAASMAIDSFLHADAGDLAAILARLSSASAAFHAVARAIDDAAGLVLANPGRVAHVAPGTNGGFASPKRTWP